MDRYPFRHAPLALAVATACAVPANADLLHEALPAVTIRTLEEPTRHHFFNGYDVATLPGGGFAVIWAEQFNYGEPEAEDLPDAVKLQRFNETAEQVGEEITLYKATNASGSIALTAPSLAADASGNLVAVWSDAAHFCTKDLSFHLIGPDVLATAELPEPVSIVEDACAPDVAVDADGDFAIVWERDGNDSSLRTFLADGTPHSSIIRLDGREPTVALSPDGTVMAGWNGSAYVDGQRFNLNGVPLGEESRLDTDITYSDSSTRLHTPAVAADADGGFVASWNQLQPNVDVVADRRTKRGQRWHADGTPGAALKYGDSAPDLYSAFHVVGDANFSANSQGDVAAVWIRHAEDELPEPKITLIDGTNTVIENERLFVPVDELSITSELRRPQVALHDAGAVIVWSQREEDGPETLRARVFKAPPPLEEPEEEPDDDVEEDPSTGNDDTGSNGSSGGSGGPVLGLLMALAGVWRWFTRHRHLR